MVLATFPEGFWFAMLASQLFVFTFMAFGWKFGNSPAAIFLGGMLGAGVGVVAFPYMVTNFSGCGCSLSP